MTFGRFGREDNTLISVTRTGIDACNSLHDEHCIAVLTTVIMDGTFLCC